MRAFSKYWLPVLLYALLIFGISSVPGQELPKTMILPDYLLHFLEYLPFGFLVCRAIKNTKESFSAKKIIFFSILLVALYAASDEFHQMFVPGRFASLSDLLCDGLGATIGVKVAL
ncbi:VanZ family protein [Candidatus Omnitrophota bacterium]